MTTSTQVYVTPDSVPNETDGPGHCIIQLRKEGWATKIEPASFGSYDNPNAVGS